MNLAKYKIPLRNAEEVLNTHNDANRKSGTKKKLCIKVCPAGHKYEVVNSCNGLLCLSKPFINDPVVVCNPITSEFIHLPEVFKLEYVKGSIDCGFGFSPKTNQYKVIRISEQGTLDPFKAAEVYTLGTGSWECLGFAPFLKNKVEFTTYLKGALYWFCHWLSSPYIDSSDLDTGSFQSVQPPPFELQTEHRVSMGVLGDCLCVCEVAFMYPVYVRVMKDCGEEKSWTKLFSIDPGCHEEWPYGLYQPMKSFENGGFLMFHSSKYKLLGETRALSLEEEQILSCFPKEVKKEITSEVVSMSYRRQCELEEVTRLQAAGRQELFSFLVAGNKVWYQHQIGPQCSVNCQSTGTGMRCR
ncbi:unnamed protein product [Prunus armeniaca]|uniref:F-box associated beta-propeller type 1 domain-containing protein n=1 Tax=Prunus armeniaca TaxID=36596 RepID=A0A6J5WUI5_PRUAR|nr:unnamed protein product [Prunus armeniaca]